MSRAWVVPAALLALLLASGGAIAAEYWAAPVFADASDHELLLANPGPAAVEATLWLADGSSQKVTTPGRDRTVHLMPSGLRTPGIAPTGVRIETSGIHPMLVGPAEQDTTSAGATLLPLSLLGQDHFVATPDFAGAPEPWVSIVATRPGTTVDLTFRIPLTAVTDGGTGTTDGDGRRTYVLDAHETLTITATEDLTGTRVVADAPVAVFAGRSDASAASGESMAGDQVPPVAMAGTEHVVCTQEIASPNWVWAAHVIAVEDGPTQVRLGGPGAATVTLAGAGDATVVPWTTEDMWLTSDRPVLVAQSMRSQDGFPPETAYVPPVSLWGREAALAVPGGTSAGAFQMHLTMAHRSGHPPEVSLPVPVERREVPASPFSCTVTDHVQVDHGDPGVARAVFGIGGGVFQSWGGHGASPPFRTVQTTAWAPCADRGTAYLAVEVHAQVDRATLSWDDQALRCSGHVRYEISRQTAGGAWTKLGETAGQQYLDDGSVMSLEPCVEHVWRVTRMAHGRSATSLVTTLGGPACTVAADDCPSFSETNPERFIVTRGEVFEHRFHIAGHGHNIVGWSATGLPAYAQIDRLTGDFLWDTREAALGEHAGLAVLLEAEEDCTARHDFVIEVVDPPPRCPVLQNHQDTLAVPLGGQSIHAWQVLDADAVGFVLHVLPPAAFHVRDADGTASAVRTSEPELVVRMEAASVPPGRHEGGLVRLVPDHDACPPEEHDLTFLVVAPTKGPGEGSGEEDPETDGQGAPWTQAPAATPTGPSGASDPDPSDTPGPAPSETPGSGPLTRAGEAPSPRSRTDAVAWSWAAGAVSGAGCLVGLLWRRRQHRK